MLALALLVLAQEPLELRDGDRVVLLGDAFFERDLAHNHLETALTARFADRNVAFRNLGWSGDTVRGEARAEFGSVEDGFRRIVRDLGELKPTVVFLAYGLNDSFAGEEGLPAFRTALGRLLEAIGSTGARVVVLSPYALEYLGTPDSPPSEQNRNLRRYGEILGKAAKERGHRFVDLFELDGKRCTENGLHLNGHGYEHAAARICETLGVAPVPWRVEIAADGSVSAAGTKVSDVTAGPDGCRFTTKADTLGDGRRRLVVRGLAPGTYTLSGGLTATAEQWAKGMEFRDGRYEALREAVAEKNRVFFDFWRPHNTTYIFGFRKREQGHLQPEFPTFAPLVEEREKEIARLRVPGPVSWILEKKSE